MSVSGGAPEPCRSRRSGLVGQRVVVSGRQDAVDDERATRLGQVRLVRVQRKAVAEAGVQINDIVVRVKGRSVTNLRQFSNNLFRSEIGEKLELEVLRDSARIKLEVSLQEPNPDSDALLDQVKERAVPVARIGILAVPLDSETAALISSLPAGCEAYSGDDLMTLPLLASGVVGTVGVATHWTGEDHQEMFDLWEKGDTEGARLVNSRMLESFAFETGDEAPNPIPTKAMMRHLGIPVGQARLPMGNAPEFVDSRAPQVLANLQRWRDAFPDRPL